MKENHNKTKRMIKNKLRLDELVIKQGLAETLKQAQALVMSGNVLYNETPMTHVGACLPVSASLRLRQKKSKFASRGGEKILPAFTSFPITTKGAICLDIGASTGGFTDCLLQQGAMHVFSLDVAKGIVAWKLRQDKRVSLLESTHFKQLNLALLGSFIDLVVIDVSFTSVQRVFPFLSSILTRQGQVVSLIKPSFEVPPSQVEAGGIVQDEQVIQSLLTNIKQTALTYGLVAHDCIPAGIRGKKKKNLEYLLYLTKNK